MRKVRLTIHVDEDRKRYGLAGGKSPLYMEDFETLVTRLAETLDIASQEAEEAFICLGEVAAKMKALREAGGIPDSKE